MTDQASILRKKIEQLNSNRKSQSKHKTLAIISGKGGVGKSNFSLNFALTLQKRGYRTLLIDMDIGMGNIDILMGTQSRFTIVDFFRNNIGFEHIITKGFGGLDYIAGGSGLSDFVDIEDAKLESFFQQFQVLLSQYDYILLDMGAGISTDSLKFILSADDCIVITTPEPTSITDAYAAMKFIHSRNNDLPLYLVVNRTITKRDGMETLQKLRQVVQQFLKRDLINLGYIPDDSNVSQAVRNQIPFIFFNEKSEAAKALREIADRYGKQQFTEYYQDNSHNFVSKLKRFLFER
ncbi:MinD/ParA family protein [Niallia sp. FSL W8-0635]|uniref:MinD/ParA family protein n=1 Tax=Niallia sp. FSL W8-0635 TaxID=2975337 RepID=UPI0009CE8873|nr:ATPase involved in chromosome partitioning [Mycobacteroides abscessus subsp. abscessus]HEO8418995.1 MinD/ParA family protein [Yersinia enterocolitica]